MKQIVAHKKIGSMQGILLVLALIAALVLLNYLVLGLLATYIGNGASSLAFWVLGGLLAWGVLHIYVVKYSYELGEDVLRINRAYGKRERHIDDIYLNNLIFLGSPEEAKKRWPNARRVKAVHTKGENATMALVYKSADGRRVVLFQPNDELRQRLVTRIKSK